MLLHLETDDFKPMRKSQQISTKSSKNTSRASQKRRARDLPARSVVRGRRGLAATPGRLPVVPDAKTTEYGGTLF